MKIQGPNPFLNVYKTNQRSAKANRNKNVQDDQLNISDEALQMQKAQIDHLRKNKVTKIKTLVESGEYRIDYEKTAEKMLQFWRS